MRLLSFRTPSCRSFSSIGALSFAFAALPLASCSLNTTGENWGREAGAGGATSSGPASGSGDSTMCEAGATRSCYTGPEGTEGKGICRAGTQTCGPKGAWNDACDEQVLPGVEDCTTGEDEDCNGLSAADLEAECVCVPGASDACQTGKLGLCAVGQHVCDATGKTFGECTETYTPSFDDCVSIADEDCDGIVTGCLGTPLFAKSYGVASNTFETFSIATGSAGNVVVGGHRAGDFWLFKLSPTGTTIWEKIIPVTGMGAVGVVRDIAITPQDDIIVIGDFTGQMDLGSGPMNAGGKRDIFVAKRNKAGDHVWAKSFGDGGGSEDQFGNAVALDASGDIFIAGRIAGTSSFSGIQVEANGTDAYVTKLDKDGNAQWVNRAGDSALQYATALAVTASGDVIVTGGFQGDIDFALPALTSAGAIDAYLVKLGGSDGEVVWSKTFGDAAGQGAFDQAGTSVAIDAKGNIDLVGNFKKSMVLPGKSLTNADATGGVSDAFIAQFNDAGALVWGQAFGDANTQVPNDVAVDPAGNLLVIGHFRGTFSFGGPDLVSPDTMNQSYNLFVAKFSPAGTHLWSAGYGDTSYQVAWAVATDAKANAFVAGHYKGTINAGVAGPISSVGNIDAFVLGFAP